METSLKNLVQKAIKNRKDHYFSEHKVEIETSLASRPMTLRQSELLREKQGVLSEMGIRLNEEMTALQASELVDEIISFERQQRLQISAKQKAILVTFGLDDSEIAALDKNSASQLISMVFNSSRKSS